MCPKVPVNILLIFPPKASQLSSINHIFLSSAKSLSFSASNGFPSVCAKNIALVFSVTALVIDSKVGLYVPISLSTKTGTKLF